MSFAELEQAVRQLPPQELTAFTALVVKLDNEAWDKQINEDAASGKLDSLFEEAEQERARGTLRNWPD
ncbi:MAG: hypothetical protein ACR2HH_10315 [Chthoniobacterales bacterium]